MKRRRVASVLFMWASLTTAGGQDQPFTASAPGTVRAGEEFQYVIEGSEQGDVTLPDLSDFQLLAGPFSSYSSQSQWVNGKMTMNTVVTYTHVLKAVRKGTLTIPPSTVKVGRKEYTTNPVQINVREGTSEAAPPGEGERGTREGASGADGSEPVFLRVVPSKREVYLGEQLVSGLKVFTRVNTRPASTAKDIPYEGFYKKRLEPDEGATRETIDGEQYVTQVIQRHILIPQKTGKVTIAPYESEWMVQKRVQRRSGSTIFDDFFDDPFFNSYQDVPVKLATPPVTITVNPLPPGAPAGYTGAVGNFTMEASMTDGEVEVNEALSLKVTIRGTGNIPLIGQPRVNLPPDHDLYDVTRSLNTSTSGQRISGAVTFEYPIVARHAGRFRIPPVRFAWFDPARRAYRSASTKEFTFTVLKGETGEGPSGVYVPGLLQESVEDLGTDIRDIHRVPGQLVPVATTLIGNRWYQLAYLLVVFVALLSAISIRMVMRRNADLKLVRNRQASREARRRLKLAERLRRSGEDESFYQEIGNALWGYLSAKLDMDTSGLTRDSVLGELDARNVEENTKSELLRILDESEFSRFAPSSEKSDVDQLYRAASTLIDTLEKRLQ